MYFLRHQIASYFSIDDEVVQAAEELMPVAVVCHIFTVLLLLRTLFYKHLIHIIMVDILFELVLIKTTTLIQII